METEGLLYFYGHWSSGYVFILCVLLCRYGKNARISGIYRQLPVAHYECCICLYRAEAEIDGKKSSSDSVVFFMADRFGNMDQNFLFGAIFCALGAVSYGVFTAFNTKFGYDKRISMMLNYAVTFVITSIINALNGDLFIPSAIQCLGFAWNGMFTMAVAATLWVMALRIGKTEKISNLAYITPFVSMLWTALILHEKITVYSIVGIVVIVSGVLLQMSKSKNKITVKG